MNRFFIVQPFRLGRTLNRNATQNGEDVRTTLTYAANSAWQQLVVLTHNLLTNFQLETGAVRRAATRKRTSLWGLQTIQSLRFTVVHRAAILVRPQGTLRLRLREPPHTRQIYERLQTALARAA